MPIGHNVLIYIYIYCIYCSTLYMTDFPSIEYLCVAFHRFEHYTWCSKMRVSFDETVIMLKAR